MRAIALLALLAASGCNHGGGSDAGAPVDCGVLTVGVDVMDPDGAYVPIEQATGGELVQGFQGFQMLFVEVRMNRVPSSTAGSVVVNVDGTKPYSQTFSELAPMDDGKGGFVAAAIPVFFNAVTIADIDGKGCTLTLQVGDKACSATTTGHVTLVYRPGCMQSPDGRISCPDGGETAHGDAGA